MLNLDQEAQSQMLDQYQRLRKDRRSQSMLE